MSLADALDGRLTALETREVLTTTLQVFSWPQCWTGFLSPLQCQWPRDSVLTNGMKLDRSHANASCTVPSSLIRNDDPLVAMEALC